MPKLIISLPTGDISKELTGDVITIGRTPDNKVQIDHHSVSAHHARLTLSGGNYRIKDLDSTNRTFVNGLPVNEAELSGSSILRIGTIECIYKLDKTESTMTNEQLQSKITELQRQIDNLVKARDMISLQNRTMMQERDDAQREAEIRLDELTDAKKLIDRLSNGQQQDAPASSDLAHKQIKALTKERDALLEANHSLKDEVARLNARLNELQHASKVASVAQQHIGVAAQQMAAAHVKAEMDESVEEEEEEPQMAVAGAEKAGAAGIFANKILSASPHLNSWLNRGAKRKAAVEPEVKTIKVTAMPTIAPPPLAMPRIAPPSAPAPPAQAAPVTPATPEPGQPEARQGGQGGQNGQGGTNAPSLSPTLRLIPPPQQPVAHNASLGSPAVKIGRVPANISPQNPEVKPTWDLLNTMRRTLHYFLRHQDELKVMEEMTESARSLTQMAGSDVLRPIYELCAALEALLEDLRTSPANINPSTLRTVGQSIDFIATLINESNLHHLQDVSTARVFVIDDDEGILETIKATMEMVHLNVTATRASSEGLTMLSEQNYDLILLDVGLPEMNGMDICSRVRAMPHHQKTPIVFLTGEATVQNRVQSTLNGGNDLIGKPFSIFELSVKAIVWIFKGHLGLV